MNCTDPLLAHYQHTKLVHYFSFIEQHNSTTIIVLQLLIFETVLIFFIGPLLAMIDGGVKNYVKTIVIRDYNENELNT